MTPPAGTSRGRVWLGVGGGGLAWAAHLAALYVLAEFGCTGGLGERVVGGVSLVAWLVLAATVAGLVAVGAAVRVSWSTAVAARERLAREAAPEGEAGLEGDASPGAANELFAGRVGVIGGALFALSIAFQALPVLFHLRACGGAVPS